MDMITLAMAKAYSDKKGGYTEKPVLTFNGDVTGKPTLDVMVKISDTIMDLSKVTMVVLSIDPTFANATDNPTELEYTAEMITVEVNDGVQTITADGKILAASISASDAGVYVAAVPGSIVGADDIEIAMWVSRIEFAETIHPIDPKFLPGVCLPVVEIADFNAITDTENSAISAAAEKKIPCVFVNTNPTTYMAAVLLFTEGDGTQQYALPGAFALIRDNATGLWSVGAATLGV